MNPERSAGARRQSSGLEAIGGFTRAGFENVQAAFADNFSRRRELGGACCAFVGGEKVADVNPGAGVYSDRQRIYARDLEVPSGGGVATARALAHAYSVFATGGHELGLRKETLDLLAAPAIPPTRGFYDECLKGEVQFSLGFMKPGPQWSFGSGSSFGAPGSGGALAFADPDAGVGYAYVTSQMGTALTGDPREVALRTALYSTLGSGEGMPSVQERRVS